MTPNPGTRMIATATYHAAGRMRAKARLTLPMGTTAITFVGLDDSLVFDMPNNYARMFTNGTENRWDHGHPNTYSNGPTLDLDEGTLHTYAISRPPAGAIAGPTYYEDARVVRSMKSDPP